MELTESQKNALRQMYLAKGDALEALMANEGIQTKAAESLGCHRNQLRQMVRRLGTSTQHIRLVAKALRAGG